MVRFRHLAAFPVLSRTRIDVTRIGMNCVRLRCEGAASVASRTRVGGGGATGGPHTALRLISPMLQTGSVRFIDDMSAWTIRVTPVTIGALLDIPSVMLLTRDL